ncbi:MAG: DNA-processing protein DprA [bacterium]|nr:DNA-processing protein DprA [bacterium]
MNNLSPAAVIDWLRLWRLLQQSSSSASALLDAFATPAAALAASPAQWRALGIAPASAQRLAYWRAGNDPELAREMDERVAADLAWCEAPGHALLTLDDADYPPLLREIADPPPLLFLKGDAALLALPQVAIVGSRQPSLAGKADAQAFAGQLAGVGLVITSGMARGIDASAHAGALRAAGRTIAVLGTGADRPYPRENGRLYEEIVARGGLIVSEFLPGALPLAMHFPRRNRIISGLSLGVLVVEAAPESGSLITARLAADQGRSVWALPGSRHHAQAQGCLLLIREGATAVTTTTHILEDLPPMMGFLRAQAGTGSAGPAAPSLPPLQGDVLSVLEALGYERRHADWLITTTGQPPASVLRALSVLELAGLIAAVPGGYERLA